MIRTSISVEQEKTRRKKHAETWDGRTVRESLLPGNSPVVQRKNDAKELVDALREEMQNLVKTEISKLKK